MRVRRTFLNGIRSQGGFYLVNEICLRGRCDALAHGRDLRDADNVRAAGLSSEAWQRKRRSLRVGMRVRRTFLNGIRSQGGFYPFNGNCLRGRCDALAHGRDLRDADNVRAAGLGYGSY